MRLEAVPHNHVFFVWKEIAPILKKAVDRSDEYSLHDVLDAILRRDMQLWIAVEDGEIKSAGVTMLQNYPQKRTCLLLFVAGEHFEKWYHLLEDIKKWADLNGCKDIEFIGRPGWKKYFEETDMVYRIIIKRDQHEQDRRRIN